MSRYYIAPLDTYLQLAHLFNSGAGTAYLCLYDHEADPQGAAWAAAGKPVLLNAVFRNEAGQDYWSQLADVSVLPDYVQEGNAPLSDFLAMPARRLNAGRLALLQCLGVTGASTVLDLEAKAAAINTAMRLRPVL